MNKHGAQNTGKTIKRILSYMKEYKFRFIFVLICILLSAVANVAGSMFIGTLIDDYITRFWAVQTLYSLACLKQSA